ncbi:MAG: hypothetical protein NC433_07230 [Clostridiales bacterium]|nr:hypothetical protein [Clostridiales bacterium]
MYKQDSFFDELEPEHFEKDGDYIDSLQEAYEVLGADIIEEIYRNSLSVLEYERTFRDYYLKMDRLIIQ